MDISFYSGDSRDLIISVVDENDKPIDLTDASIEWVLAENDLIKLKKNIGEGVTIVNAQEGLFKIEISSDDTGSLKGDYKQLARVTISGGKSSIVLDETIKIEKSLI